MAKVTHKVVNGDTLSEIAVRYGTTVAKLVQLNGIEDPDFIVTGQELVIIETNGSTSGTGAGSSGSAALNTTVTIKAFGIQSGTDNTLYASWDWNQSNTDHYEVEWYYDSGDYIWFVGNKSTTEDRQSLYTIPDNADRVRLRVKPVSKKHTVDNRETSYWTAEWCTYQKHEVSDNPPTKPGVPTVSLDKYKLTADLENLDVNATSIEFQIVKNDTSVFKTGTAKIITNSTSYSCTVDAGAEYKVRCRSVRDSLKSDWSEYSSNISTIPSVPTAITSCKATSESSVYLEWPAVKTATSYDVEYTTKKAYFDNTDQTTTKTGIELNHFELIGLESGEEYFFRVRAVNNSGNSGWSGIQSVVIGKKPAAPTTWSSTTTVITGEDLTLYWVHNAADGSSQTFAEVELTIGDAIETYTVKNSTEEEEKDKTSSYKVDTKEYPEGTKMFWRVRTAGITKTYGEWSVQRSVDIYAPPTLSLSVTDIDGNALETLTSFPFYVYALAGPNTQVPIGYHLSIVSNDIYETVDNVGNTKTVNKGEKVYSKYFDISDPLLVEFSPANVNLDNNMSYTVVCTVAMNSGLTAEGTSPFTVGWTDILCRPNAEISVDKDGLVTHIRPYCEEQQVVFYRVKYESGKYVTTDEEVDVFEGLPLEPSAYYPDEFVYTTTGEKVFSGTTTLGVDIYYCIVTKTILVKDLILSVYRREFDGTFTEIATGLYNSKSTFVTDPHPALDYARYRIVAIAEGTGAVSYYDVPGYPIGEPAIVVQWDEAWSRFDTSSEDAMEQPAWSGSLLKLPYNVDVSSSTKTDKALIEYIGREHPVSYYGTQLGETATWNAVFDKSDKETLYTLRRLARWKGDVYVREPSGSGYWASIEVTFPQKHLELTVPVTFNITRVEGGM